MAVVRIAISLIALVMGGWLAFDGTRALVTGDYISPRSGPHAGQLGPWSKVVSSLGLDPRSSAVKWAHVSLGLFWLVALSLFLTKAALGWNALFAVSILSLWYLPLDTLLGVIELCLLFLPLLRNLK